MKKIIATIAFFIVALIPGVIFAQGTDNVTLVKPSENQSVGEQFKIEWTMTDSDIADPAYFIDVFNLGCSQTGGNIGRITNSGATKSGNSYAYEWNTKSGNLANSLQSGGNYCMRVCGILAENGSVYSLCDKKSFIYASGSTSSNKPPVITSAKEGFVVTLNQIFTHTVEASDPDGDTITYSFVSAPDFLSIDKNSGQISGKPTEVGDIRFIVKADDSKGGITTEEFILRIQLTGAKKEVEFTFPKSASVLTPRNNLIKWEVQSGIQVNTITLSYSTDKSDWTDITKLDRNTGEYAWNVNDLEEGKYFLRILLVDSNNKLYEIISDEFTLSSQDVVTQTEITGLTPEEGSIISENRPVISAVFNTPDGVSIDTEKVKLTLNERVDLIVCEITETGISCDVVSELENGTYKVYVEIVDSEGATLVKEWNFTVDTGESGPNNERASIASNTFQLVIIIFAVGFLLIALPWSIYIIIKRRRNKAQDSGKLSEDTIIHPIQPVAPPADNIQQPAAPQPIIGDQGLNIENANQPVSNTTSQVATDTSAAPSLGTQEIETAVPSTPVYVEPETTATIGSQAIETPDLTTPTATNDNMQTPATSFTPPITSQQPKMYDQEEIPEWLQKDIKDTTAEQDKTTSMNDVITQNEVNAGAKVYDPFGLALKPDETEDNG